MSKKNSTIPTVLAFEKKLVPSDGYLYGTTWEERHKKATPLAINEKSVRGTISNRQPDAVLGNPVKLSAALENPNPQTVDACALAMDQDTLKLVFTLKVLGAIEKPSACNNAEFNNAYRKAALKYIEVRGFNELARRYALNIANGRYFWRNRLGAEKIEVDISANGEKLTVDATKFSLRDFKFDNVAVDELAKVDKLAELIADALCGKGHLIVTVEAYAMIGKGQDVYPSEEMILDKLKEEKGEGKKSKVLYAVNGIAAMHSQKIGNALRTIDTWYPDFDPNIGPIAVEPYGAVTNLGRAFRDSKGTDFYSLFDRYAVGEKLENKEQEHFVMAVLVRGGVFGQSGKKKGLEKGEE